MLFFLRHLFSFPPLISMFDLSREEQQQARSTKPVQSLEVLAQDLGVSELVKPTCFVEIKNALQETFRVGLRRSIPSLEARMSLCTMSCVLSKKFITPGAHSTRISLPFGRTKCDNSTRFVTCFHKQK